MRIEVYGQQLDITAALRDYVDTEFTWLQPRGENLSRIGEAG
ncbi:MAG: hypothetical protein ABIO84_10695 [Lysobacter sp.]